MKSCSDVLASPFLRSSPDFGCPECMQLDTVLALRFAFYFSSIIHAALDLERLARDPHDRTRISDPGWNWNLPSKPV